VDDVSIETRSTTILVAGDGYTFDFDHGMGDWSAHNGGWEVGAPTSGPSGAHSGSSVGGTVLAGDYPNTTSSLVSPTIELPAIGAGEEIHLRFWQWFSFDSHDVGDVQVSQLTAPGVWSAWTTLTTYSGSSGVWSNALVDLSAYAGNSVRIGFQLRQGSYSYVGPGWYVDDVLIEIN
jgi:bacillopeptidase F (M6 metalloprotease family)